MRLNHIVLVLFLTFSRFVCASIPQELKNIKLKRPSGKFYGQLVKVEDTDYVSREAIIYRGILKKKDGCLEEVIIKYMIDGYDEDGDHDRDADHIHVQYFRNYLHKKGSPVLVNIYDPLGLYIDDAGHGRNNKRFIIVYPFVEGSSLKEIINKISDVKDEAEAIMKMKEILYVFIQFTKVVHEIKIYGKLRGKWNFNLSNFIVRRDGRLIFIDYQDDMKYGDNLTLITWNIFAQSIEFLNLS